MDCTICARLAQPATTPIYANTGWVVMEALGERPGWLVVAARRHFEGIWNMAPDEVGDFGHAVHSASKALQHAADTAKVYMVGLGEGVAHCHFLLIPRIEGLGQDVRASLKNWGDKVSDPEVAVLLKKKYALLSFDGFRAAALKGDDALRCGDLRFFCAWL